MIKYSVTAFVLALTVSANAQTQCKFDRNPAQVTSGWNGVGWVSYGKDKCTAFRYNANTVMTAAHCVGRTSGSLRTKKRPELLFRDSAGRLTKVKVQAWRSMPDSTDIAVLLSTELPEWVIPVPLSYRNTTNSSFMAVIAGGCAESCFKPRKQLEGRFRFLGGRIHPVHRVAFFHFSSFSFRSWLPSSEFSVCPGDSGSPILDLETGGVVGVITDYNLANRAVRSVPIQDVKWWVGRL